MIITRHQITNVSYFLYCFLFVYLYKFFLWSWSLNWYWTCLPNNYESGQNRDTEKQVLQDAILWKGKTCKSSYCSTAALFFCPMVFCYRSGRWNQAEQSSSLEETDIGIRSSRAGRIFRAGYIRKGRCMCVVGEESFEDSLER